MKAKVKIKGYQQLLKNIGFYSRDFEKKEKIAVQKGGQYLEGRIRQEMSHTSSYEGSPYSRVKYPTGINTGLIKPLKDYAIRSRTGRLVSALTGVLFKGVFGFQYQVALDNSRLPRYGLYVFQGTRIMHARDPITAMYNDKGVQKKILEIIKNELRKTKG